MFSFVFDKEELIWKNKERDHLRSMFQFYLGMNFNINFLFYFILSFEENAVLFRIWFWKITKAKNLVCYYQILYGF